MYVRVRVYQIAWLWAPNPQSRQYAWYSQPASNDDEDNVAIELTAVAHEGASGDGDSSKDSFAITGDSDEEAVSPPTTAPKPKQNKD